MTRMQIGIQRERIVFGGGPVPEIPGRLFVLFVEPSKPGADIFYAEDPVQARALVAAAYPGDRLIALPPVGMPPADTLFTEATIDTVVADLAELVSAADYNGISDGALIRCLCRAGLEFVHARPWESHALLVAELTGAAFPEAEIAVTEPTAEGAGFSLYPGRGAFARMAGSFKGSPLEIDEVLALQVRELPEWAAPAIRALREEPLFPVPVRISGRSRVPVGDDDAALLAAVAAAITASGEGHAGSVCARVSAWLA